MYVYAHETGTPQGQRQTMFLTQRRRKLYSISRIYKKDRIIKNLSWTVFYIVVKVSYNSKTHKTGRFLKGVWWRFTLYWVSGSHTGMRLLFRDTSILHLLLWLQLSSIVMIWVYSVCRAWFLINHNMSCVVFSWFKRLRYSNCSTCSATSFYPLTYYIPITDLVPPLCPS